MARQPRQPLTLEKQDLAERYLPLARALAYSFAESYPDSRDEFESSACLALVEAAEAFDPDRQVRFSTFARFRITGALRDVLRRRILLGWRQRVQKAPSALPLYSHAEEHGQVLVIQPDPPVGRDLESTDAVESLLHKLPKKHANVCRLVYLSDMTHARAALALHYSRSRIAALHAEALALLKSAGIGHDAASSGG